MRIIILAGILIALAIVGATYTRGTDNSSEGKYPPPQNKSLIIFDALKDEGIKVENVFTSNGSELNKAFGLEDSNIPDESVNAFIIFRYSAQEGIDNKVLAVLNTIYTALLVEPSIEGVLVMPYDPNEETGRTSLIYTNRSYAQEVAVQNLSLRKFYNQFDVYVIKSEVR